MIAPFPCWRHQMKTFSALLANCAGNPRSPVNSPHKGQWRGALKFLLICAWISTWVNNREAGDLKRHRAHYNFIVTPMKEVWNMKIKTNGITVEKEYSPYNVKTPFDHRQWLRIIFLMIIRINLCVNDFVVCYINASILVFSFPNTKSVRRCGMDFFKR